MLIICFYHGVGFCFVVMIHDKQVKRQPEHFKEENILLSLTDLWNDKNKSVSAAHLIFFLLLSPVSLEHLMKSWKMLHSF